MALFWSKKPKAEKNYGEETRKAKTVEAKPQKTAKTGDKKAVKAVAKPAADAKSVAKNTSPVGAFSDATAAIIHPHVTEKSGLLSQNGVYTFKVAEGANKDSVSRAVNILYKVNPVIVAIINLPAKRVFVKGRRGVVSGKRKALVTLKKGDKIDFV